MRTIYSIIIGMIGLSFFSCKDLDEMNINPNGVDPSVADPSLLISTVITNSGTAMVGFGFGDIAGVVQHTQKDGWSGGHNEYDWNTRDWGNFFDNLRQAKELLRKAEETENDFYAGAAKVFMAYNFGAVTDFWGDAPFSEALQGKEGLKKPKYDSQKDIYQGILVFLEEANTLLSKNQGDYAVSAVQDVLYGGNVAQWRKFANSLALRYYLRISAKEPATAEAGIRKLLGDPARYPLILDAADDAAFLYPANNRGTSWPSTTAYDITETDWRRLKMCSTLVEKLLALNDPRIAVWANKVAIPLVPDTDNPNRDEIVNGERFVGSAIANKYLADWEFPLNYHKEYVGLPPAFSKTAYVYNLNPNLEQAPINPHASHISDLYKKSSDPLLKARMLSAAEMHFSLAEIAMKGWGGSAEEHYYAGIRTSFEVWGVSGQYNAYIAIPGVKYDGTLEQIMEQKWIASWSAATEAWFDWRRTGLPDFKPGQFVKMNVLPLRFYYGNNELNYNTENVKDAINRLEKTAYYSEEEGANTAWSKMWLLQGTGKPW